jgi:hypothetical protein
MIPKFIWQPFKINHYEKINLIAIPASPAGIAIL